MKRKYMIIVLMAGALELTGCSQGTSNSAKNGTTGIMLLPTVRLRLILQLPVSLITGPGSMSHGRGRKEAAEYVEL